MKNRLISYADGEPAKSARRLDAYAQRVISALSAISRHRRAEADIQLEVEAG